MPFVTGQSFLEDIDDSRTLFTAQEPFELDSLEIFQNSLALLPDQYIEVDTLRARILLDTSQQTWTYDSAVNTLYCAGHGISADTLLVVWSSTFGGLPSGLSRALVYYAQVIDTDRIQLSLTAGGAAVAFSQSSSGILYLSETEAPLIANGPLHYNCVTLGDTIDSSTVIGFWSISDFQAQYAQGVSTAIIQDILLDADDMVSDYTTISSYALALTGVSPYRLFRRVQGELAFRLLANRPNLVNSVESSEKEYADTVKRMKQTYSASSSTVLLRSLDEILRQLIEYKKEESESETSAYLDNWGSGRFFGIPVNDDPLTNYP